MGEHCIVMTNVLNVQCKYIVYYYNCGRVLLLHMYSLATSLHTVQYKCNV